MIATNLQPLNSQKRLALSVLFLLIGAFSFAQVDRPVPGAAEGETVVITADVPAYNSLDYHVVSSITFQPGFSFTAGTDDDEFFAKMIGASSNIPPSLDHNFVRTEVALEPYTDEQVFAGADKDGRRVSYSYSDGLGRPIQTVIA